MKTYIKMIISIIFTIIPLVAIIGCGIYFNSNSYLIKHYYGFALDSYISADAYNFETTDGENTVYLIEGEDYYRIKNYDRVISKFKGDALENFKANSHIIEFGGEYYTLPYSLNSSTGYLGKYDYEVIDSSFTSKRYKITSYFCDMTDEDLNCDLESMDYVYKVETEFAIERNLFTWQITEFEMPVEDEAHSASSVDPDEYDEEFENSIDLERVEINEETEGDEE